MPPPENFAARGAATGAAKTGAGAGAEAAPLLPARLERAGYDAGGRALLDDVSLTLRAGPPTVVMGPNGAGKTLLLKLLHGLIEPARGRVTWGGAPLSPALRRRHAMVFQKPVLLRRSAAANVDFALSLAGRPSAEEREALLARAGLAGLGPRPARSLSGGEQQRLALARALALRPEVLFLDEPTASLDPASARAIEDTVRWAADAGVKIILVTHDAGQARRLAGDVVFLHRGRVQEHAPAGDFFETPQSRPARDFLAGRIVE
ncbi:MAG: ATP-binding cassette domain-containing protein [Rhodospirillales bacterium]